MTTLAIRSEFELQPALTKTSQDFNVLYATDVTSNVNVIRQDTESQYASVKSPVIIDLFPQKAPKQSFSKFDQLVQSLEDDPETSVGIAEARQWVAEEFYSEHLTLASLRLKVGMSQRQLGLACSIEQPHVSRYESGKHEPSLSLAFDMAKALNVSIETLFEAWKNSRSDC